MLHYRLAFQKKKVGSLPFQRLLSFYTPTTNNFLPSSGDRGVRQYTHQATASASTGTETPVRKPGEIEKIDLELPMKQLIESRRTSTTCSSEKVSWESKQRYWTERQIFICSHSMQLLVVRNASNNSMNTTPRDLQIAAETKVRGGGGVGGGGFRLKPQMKTSFVWVWPYGILDAHAHRHVHDVWCTCSFNSAGRGVTRHHCGAGHDCITLADDLRASWQHFALCFLCGLPVIMKSERPSKNDEQHYFCVVWEGKTVLQTLDVAFSASSQKSSFLRDHLFLQRRTSTSFASSRRFLRWQSENQGDSCLGRVRIIISDGICALVNAQQMKMVSREACVCAIWSRRTGLGVHVCMCTCLRHLFKLLGSAARCWPTPCCGTAWFVRFFGRGLQIYPVERLRLYIKDLTDWFLSGCLDKRSLQVLCR